ncbi:type IV secretion system protein VirB8 [Neorickettsia risticii str. Illinois]|uniref:Type IV secretion system protein VirB8 n=1 Tax=Neorickettsia risticii (strain Illinois) TaxID=434131 RepID=C6V479_NEORI|nr:conjugal transfer protein TraJ [Neorickettsia risticii]ACT69208.1 type IV secretion system protein VirB8 [Neorickettsia risticii str. Illinois]
MHERDLKEALVEGGKYYKEGLSWHCTKNYYVFVERVWLLMFLALLFSTLCVMGLNIYSILPLKTTTNFLRYTDSIDTDNIKTTRLYDVYKKNNDLQTVIDRYLLSEYIEVWEEGTGQEDKFIQLNSSHMVYEKFLKSRSGITNTMNKRTEIADVQIHKDTKTSGKVAVAKVRSYEDGSKNQEKTVKVAFRTTDVILAHRNIAPLELIVSGYEEIQ